MDFSFSSLMELAAMLIMAYLIIANAPLFSQAVSAGASAFTSSVTALQGR